MSSTDTTIIAPIAPIAIEPDPAERGVLQKRVDDETLKPLERIDCGLLLIEKFGCSARTERVVRRLVKELRNYSHASLIVQNRVRNKASALRDVMVAQLALRPAKPVEEEPVAPTTSVTPSATGFDKLVGNVSLLSDTGDFAAKLRMYSGVEPRGNTPEDLIQAIGGEALLEHLLKHPSLISQDKTVIDTAYREVVASLVPLLDEKSEAGLRKLWAAQTQPFVELVKNSKDELDVALTASGRTLQAVLFACDWPGKRLSFVDMVQDVPSCDIEFQLMYGSPKPERLAPFEARCRKIFWNTADIERDVTVEHLHRAVQKNLEAAGPWIEFCEPCSLYPLPIRTTTMGRNREFVRCLHDVLAEPGPWKRDVFGNVEYLPSSRNLAGTPWDPTKPRPSRCPLCPEPTRRGQVLQSQERLYQDAEAMARKFVEPISVDHFHLAMDVRFTTRDFARTTAVAVGA